MATKPNTTEQETSQPNLGKPLLEWEAPEFTEYEKNSNWFGLWLIISVTAVALAVIFGNYLLAIFLALAAISVFLQGLKKPRIIKFTITPRGIGIGNIYIPYEDMESFWILYEPGQTKELLLKTKRVRMPNVVVPIDKENPVRIRQLLVDFVPEKEQKQSLIDIVMRIMRF